MDLARSPCPQPASLLPIPIHAPEPPQRFLAYKIAGCLQFVTFPDSTRPMEGMLCGFIINVILRYYQVGSNYKNLEIIPGQRSTSGSHKRKLRRGGMRTKMNMSPHQNQDREWADEPAAGIDGLVSAGQAEPGEEAWRGWKHRGDGVALSITENAMQGKGGASHWTSVMWVQL